MAFNWFRRQHNEPSAAPKEEQPKPTQEAESAQKVELSNEPSINIAADRLSWAKAAYKQIQEKQKLQQEQVAQDTTQSSALSEELSTEAEPEANDTEIVEDTKLPNQVETGDQTHREQLAGVNDESAQSSEQLEISTTIPDGSDRPVETQQESAPLPFWAKAEADRQARLEQLKATAIEVPEPEAVETEAATDESTTEIPVLAFDEGFVWSTEVLAAQGRRPEDISIEEITWLKKLRQGLNKTRRSIVNQLKAIVGQGPLNQAAVMEIEALLLQADVGVEATDHIIEALQNRLRQEVLPPDAAIAYLKQILRDMLEKPLQQSYKATFAPEKDTLNIWLMTGVNGAGKTTTIGKIAHIAQKSGYKCLIAAADTFRAAAVEQVKIWGARSGIEVVANPGENTDPAAVVFDAISAAQARGTQLLLVDTAGRLQNKKNLMDELSKIRRIVDKKAADAHVESLLVLDATLGQNGLRQAEIFAQAAQLSGVVITKLDGTAKGGVALAVVQQLGLPIRFIGAGEGIEDLRPFSSYEFVEALLSS